MADSFQKKAVAFGLILVAIGVASIAYYYVIALPKHNAARLRFEQEKYAEEKSAREWRESDERIEKEQKETDKTIRESALSICLNFAEQNSGKTYCSMEDARRILVSRLLNMFGTKQQSKRKRLRTNAIVSIGNNSRILATQLYDTTAYRTVFLTNATKSLISSSVVSKEVISLTSEVSSFQT